MKKPAPKKITKDQKPDKEPRSSGIFSQPLNILYSLILLAYIFIMTFTPNLMALDTNTPKFFATSVLNLLVFIILWLIKDNRANKSYFNGFFYTNLGLVYFAFLLINLLSFVKSVNLTESILQFSKVFTVFFAVVNIYRVLQRDLKLVWILIISLAALLLFDAVSVFYYINKFIHGEIDKITDIKTVYSNKNILASAIFVKLPFALWLFIYEKRWIRVIAWVILVCGITATFFMATRAFYLGLLVISIVLLVYLTVKFFTKHNRTHLYLAISYVAAICVALVAFSVTQKFFYPKKKVTRHTKGVAQQLASIKDFDTSTGLRIDAWRYSWKLIKENPVLGVGSGNWKIASLKHENQKNNGFIYLYKAHNDFIEISTETGLAGGLLYLSIFVLVFLNFLRYNLHNKDDNSLLPRVLFLSLAGLAFYSVDAFFNFPADRPEILMLFSFSLASGMAGYLNSKKNTDAMSDSNHVNKIPLLMRIPPMINGLIVVAMVLVSALLYENFQSSKAQRIVYQEIMSGKLRKKADEVIPLFPKIPNVSIWGESIATLKARYLINEGRNEEAIEILRNDHSTPWDARREYFMAMAFNNLKMEDSAFHYAELSYRLKPNYFKSVYIMADIYQKRNESEKAEELYNTYLSKNKKNNQAWVMASNVYVNRNDYQKAYDLIQEASKYLSHDTLVKQQYQFLKRKLELDLYLPFYKKGVEYYSQKRYAQAIDLFSEFINKVPDEPNTYQLRAFCFYYQKEYQKAIDDANRFLDWVKDNSSVINLRGVCYRALGNLEDACRDFKKAMEMNNTSGKNNYEQFCQGVANP